MYKKHPVLCSMAAAAVVVILFQVFWGIAVVSGNSMTPYYEDGDLVLFNRVENPEKNQVVIAYVGDKYVIKRIVAVQGDVITICWAVLMALGAIVNYMEQLVPKQEFVVPKQGTTT